MVRYIRNSERVVTWLDLVGDVYTCSKDDILNLYDQYATDCAKKINGDYAMVIGDATNNLIYGATDRMGEKTLYYYKSSQGFGYGSSILELVKTIRQLEPKTALTIDANARQCYFTLQYIPSPSTIIKEIKKLNPGEWFTYSLTTKQLQIEQYWDLYDNTNEYSIPQSYEEAKDVMNQLITQAIADRINIGNNERLGTFLSGGIDSSIVSMYATKLMSNIECYSMSFYEDAWDESFFAEQVAKHLGVKFNKFVCTAQDALHVMEDMQQYYDEPMGDASMIPTSFLCEMAGKHVNITLGGDGGDEVFWGYPRYLRYASKAWIYNIPKVARDYAAFMFDKLGKSRLATSFRLNNIQELYMNRRPSNDAELFDATKVQQSLEQCKYLFANHDIRRCFNDFDIKTLMCHAYNVKLDRASLRANIQTRVPLLDYRLVEYSRLLPIEYCYTKQTGQKRILRDLLYSELPRELFERKKSGFGVPIGEWFRGALKDYLIDTLNSETVEILPDFDGEKLLQIRDRHIAGLEDQTTLLWLCVNYIAWYKLYKQI